MRLPRGLALLVPAAIIVVAVFAAVRMHDGPVGREFVEGIETGGGIALSSVRPLMGTDFRVTIWAPHGKAREARQAIDGVFDYLASLEQLLSSWLPESETSEINRAAGGEPLEVGGGMQTLLERALFWSEKTGGAFDVTGGPLFELWEKAREREAIPSSEEIEHARTLSGYRKLHLAGGKARLEKPGMKLGFGAIAKGFAADLAALYLEEKGLPDFLIDAGGDLLARGRHGDRPWRLAVRHPRDKESFLARLEATDCAVASSGDYERYFEVEGKRYAHIIDPRTGRPARHLTAVTVIARTATDADALATALFVMKADAGLDLVESLPEVEALLVDEEGEIVLSSGLSLEGERLSVEWD